jgi:NAD+-dependent protein deacetylase sirtuin 4
VTSSIEELARLLEGRRFAILTGAGCSTESGIPDYRGPETRRRARNPMKYQAFLRDPKARVRYWARAAIGWSRIQGARPNPAHFAITRLVDDGCATGLITQNVDRLHTHAGSRDVVELHGALAEVRCMECGAIEARDEVQRRLLELNPGWSESDVEIAPDGDAEIPMERLTEFRVVDCARCGGFLKPNVVFFGETVPAPLVERAYAMVEASSALLVVGSSLAVFSGYRFVRRAHDRKMPIALVNLGESRADPLANVIVAAPAGEILPALAERIARSGGLAGQARSAP